jgi:exodeoxyribonuclease V beta subunit
LRFGAGVKADLIGACAISPELNLQFLKVKMSSNEIPIFNVLDRNLEIHRNYLLEASAGTGKTFAVENLFVRLLIENSQEQEPISLQQIVAVTFTRAAASDLKNRIQSKIIETVNYLESFNNSSVILTKIPDYLLALVEIGNLKKAIQKLNQALFCFDEAQIFTIHSFCHRLLNEYLFEGGISLKVKGEHEPLSTERCLKIIQDFFRTEISSNLCSPEQFRKLADNKDSLEKLKMSLLKEVNKGVNWAPLPSFQEQFGIFCKKMSFLKSQGIDNPEKIIEDFQKQAPFYKGICDKQQRINPKNHEKILRFAHLFYQNEWTAKDFDLLIKDGLYLCEAFDPSNQKKIKASLPSREILYYPDLIPLLYEHLFPLVNEAKDKGMIFKKIAYHCQKHVRHYKEIEEIKDYDDLLKEMQRAVNNPAFVDKIRLKYKVAIIDEFQDTDPIQWEIFQKLFISNDSSDQRFLYLVGDPKQAIYSFRQADIYTYMTASQIIGLHHTSSLNTNYRSQESLVNALNILFSSAKNFMPLPRLNRHLEYRTVKAGNKIPDETFNDGKGSLHFFAVTSDKKRNNQQLEFLEETYFFPFIIQEISRLYLQNNVSLRKCAILVADRYQAQRMAEALSRWDYASFNQRHCLLANSPAISAMLELLTAVVNPRNISNLKISLGGVIIGWTHDKLNLLEDYEVLESILIKFYFLRTTLNQKGVLIFFDEFMESCFSLEGVSISEKLFSYEKGLELYNDLWHVAELLAIQQSQDNLSLNGLIAFLENLKNTPQTEDQAIKRRTNPDSEGINILTLHSSKGLEFDVVFALGLANYSKTPPKQFLDLTHPTPLMVPILDEQSEEYLKVCEELDAEKMRLFYVGMTRAKYRVYAPALFFQEAHKTIQGTASPMSLFLDKFKNNKIFSEKITNCFDKNHLFQLIDDLSINADIKGTDLNTISFELKPNIAKSIPELVQPLSDYLPGLPYFIHSYSSLVKTSLLDYVISELQPPHDFSFVDKNVHTLPSGNLIGNLLHGILEIVPLQSGCQYEVQSLISKQVAGTPFEEWGEVVNQIIFNTLNIYLPLHGQHVSLGMIDPHKVYRETEFLYATAQNIEIEEFQYSKGFLKGVIDLIFEHQGKYYLVDWKSNWLGPTLQDYHPVHLKAAMKKNNYYLQAKIYKEALRLYLKNILDIPFDDLFGGVFYVFLRGLSPSNDSAYGVYHFFPE